MSLTDALARMFRGFIGDVYPTPPPRQLPAVDARGFALEAFGDFLGDLEYTNREAKKTPTFKIPRANIFTSQAPDPVQMPFPSIACVPLRGAHDPFRLAFLEGTYGQFGAGTALYQFGEYTETFTLEMWGAHDAPRTAMMAGITSAMRRGEWSNGLLLPLASYFGISARFTLIASEHLDDLDVVRGRVRGHLYILLEVPEVELLDAVTLKPRFQLVVEEDDA